ncbi:hypothetical protein V2J09_015186 [Rumex salicifolius]
MSVLTGNLIPKSSFHLQSRLVLLVLLKPNCNVRCPKGRQYGSSSMPVRYIPKKLREAETSESFSGSETKSLNTRSKSSGVEKPKISDSPNYEKFVSSSSNSFRHEIRDANLYTNGGAFKGFNNLLMDEKPDVDEEMGYDIGNLDCQSMEEFEDFDEELEVRSISAKGELRVQDSKTKTDAAKKAVELLAGRAFSAMELRKKLLAKRFPSNIIDAVLCDLQERGMLNDSLYAEAYSRSRWSSSSWGPRRIKQALYMKGVHQVDAEKAVKAVFEEGEEGDQHLRLGMSKSSLDQLYMHATKQWLKSQDATWDTRKGRMIRWLQYRGFDWSVVGVILKKLESQYPS